MSWRVLVVGEEMVRGRGLWVGPKGVENGMPDLLGRWNIGRWDWRLEMDLCRMGIAYEI